MSKHSKHGRGKHAHKMKNRIRPMQPGMSTDVTQSATADVSSNLAYMGATPPPTPPTNLVKPQQPPQKRQAGSAALPLHYEFIPGDLKAIGILTVIVVAILVVLAIFLK